MVDTPSFQPGDKVRHADGWKGTILPAEQQTELPRKFAVGPNRPSEVGCTTFYAYPGDLGIDGNPLPQGCPYGGRPGRCGYHMDPPTCGATCAMVVQGRIDPSAMPGYHQTDPTPPPVATSEPDPPPLLGKAPAVDLGQPTYRPPAKVQVAIQAFEEAERVRKLLATKDAALVAACFGLASTTVEDRIYYFNATNEILRRYHPEDFDD